MKRKGGTTHVDIKEECATSCRTVNIYTQTKRVYIHKFLSKESDYKVDWGYHPPLNKG